MTTNSSSMEAKKHATEGEAQFMHQRFLRAALFLLFAYAESVVNGWLYRVLEKRNEKSRFDALEMRSLDQKMDVLHDAISTGGRKPNLTQAKRIRNLWVHTKPDSEVKAYEHLSVSTVEHAASELESWMSTMGTAALHFTSGPSCSSEKCGLDTEEDGHN